MKECPFCSGDVIVAQCVHETNSEYVLHNIRPATAGQVLVIPKRHVDALRLLPPNELSSLVLTVQYVANTLVDSLDPKPIGMNYASNEGEWAGQSVEHAHFHIMPRYADDGIAQFHLFHRDPRTKRNLTPQELEPRVEAIRQLFT